MRAAVTLVLPIAGCANAVFSWQHTFKPARAPVIRVRPSVSRLRTTGNHISPHDCGHGDTQLGDVENKTRKCRYSLSRRLAWSASVAIYSILLLGAAAHAQSVGEVQRRIARDRSDVASLQQQIARLGSENSSLKSQIRQLQQKLNSLTTSNRRVARKNRKLRTHLTNLRGAYSVGKGSRSRKLGLKDLSRESNGQR